MSARYAVFGDDGEFIEYCTDQNEAEYEAAYYDGYWEYVG